MLLLRACAAATVFLLGAACTDEGSGSGTASAGSTASTRPSATPTPTPNDRGTSPPPSPEPDPTPTAVPDSGSRTFDADAAVKDVRLLAGEIGPRLATGPAFRQAGRVVALRFRDLGYDVTRPSFRVPAGDSWGAPVRAGRSFNVVAVPVGFDPGEPHRLIGAHLDTVAVAPGAEDNASGVAVLLELARLAATRPTALPTVFVAFGAEEPRGPADDEHHFGSRHYVATMPRAQARNLRAMASLDRVGVGRSVPVCTGPLDPGRVQREVLLAAGRVDVPAAPCENTASDHWSFEKAGFPVVRFGSTSYAAYHSADDLPRVVDRDQLRRTGRVAWEWLRA